MHKIEVILHTNIYNMQTLHRMGFHKVSDEWIRRDNKKKASEKDELSRTVPEATPTSPTRSISPAPEVTTQCAPSSSIQPSKE